MEAIARLADGTHSVRDIAEALGNGSDAGVRRALGPLRYLWYNNALTWLPPGG